MRAGIVRTDLGRGVFIADIDSRNQYPYASAVPGESRTLERPVDEALLDVVRANPLPVAVTGLNTSTAVDTRLATGLSLRVFPGVTYTSLPVGGTGAAQKTYIRDQLNSGFASAGLPLTASVVGTNQLRITTTTTGEQAYVEINSQGSAGYTGALNYVLGISPGTFRGPSQQTMMAALKDAIYSGSAFNVSTGAIEGAGYTVNTGANVNFGLLGSAAFVEQVADMVAPKFVEGGDVLLSVAEGSMSKLRDPNFFYKGVTGAALYVTEDDGSTPFTYP